MTKKNFNSQWNFKFNGKTETVDLPHDYSIGQKRDTKAFCGTHGGFFPGGDGVYRKNFYAPDDGRKVFLEFEGVYMNAAVSVNHSLVMFHPYGYTSFICDLTPYLHRGLDNLINVNVSNNAQPNSRWYTGSGIYRNVWLMTAGNIYIAPYGVFVSTPDLSTADIAVTLNNSSGSQEKIILRNTIFDKNGQNAGLSESEYIINPGENIFNCKINIPNAMQWSVDSPSLYTLKSEIICAGTVLDIAETVFGFRTISFDAANGFMLNGKKLNLKGGCVHHDCGLLGSASFNRAEERKVELLKQSGFNAVRCAHNPPSPAFLDACDKQGMLVINEAFDMWRREKTPYDYHLHFDDWWKRDMQSMIFRDRNHPGIILWSTGNEIEERDGRSDGYYWAKELADYVRSLDNTRPVTNALCGLWAESIFTPEQKKAAQEDEFAFFTTKFAEPLDVVGYNYLLGRYESDGIKFPNRIIYGSESFPIECFDNWEAVEKFSFVAGDFVWTALDYLGEAGLGRVHYDGKDPWHCSGYPWHQAYCGDIDICGFKRPQSYYRDFVWGIGTKPFIGVYKPELYGQKWDTRWGWYDVVNSWTWPGFEEKPIEVEIYSGADEAELIVNGVSLGRKPAGKAARYIAKFETVYAPGEIVAITYEKGKETSRSVLRTAGKPASIRLTADRAVLSAADADLSFITVEILDTDGNIVHNADNNIHFSVSGVGKLLTVGTGNPVSEEMYTGPMRRAYYGRAMAVVKSNNIAGKIVLTAAAEGIQAAQILINVE